MMSLLKKYFFGLKKANQGFLVFTKRKSTISLISISLVNLVIIFPLLLIIEFF